MINVILRGHFRARKCSSPGRCGFDDGTCRKARLLLVRDMGRAEGGLPFSSVKAVQGRAF